MRYLTLNEVLELYLQIMEQSGGTVAVRDLNAPESALAQSRMTFGAPELYPTIVEKAAALGFSFIKNHSFVDGNKRTGQAVMETFLVPNGYEIQASVEELKQLILEVAAGGVALTASTNWLRDHIVPTSAYEL